MFCCQWQFVSRSGQEDGSPIRISKLFDGIRAWNIKTEKLDTKIPENCLTVQPIKDIKGGFPLIDNTLN
jgi:hypothetical protein